MKTIERHLAQGESREDARLSLADLVQNEIADGGRSFDVVRQRLEATGVQARGRDWRRAWNRAKGEIARSDALFACYDLAPIDLAG